MPATRLRTQLHLLTEAFSQVGTVLDLADIARRGTGRLYARTAALELHHVGPGVTVQGSVRFIGTRNVSLGLETILDPGIVLATEGSGEISLAERVYVGPNVTMFSHSRILVEHDVLIAANCVLSTRQRAEVGTAGLGGAEAGDIVLGTGCWLASNVVIGPGVTIGAGAVIGAHAVVLDDVPPRTLAAGAPATVRRSF